MMTTLNKKELLDRSIEDLHETAKSWTSEIEFWLKELEFFNTLLQTVSEHTGSEYGDRILEQLQNKVTYYQGEVIPEMRQKVRNHEGYLGELITNKKGFNDETLRENHRGLADEMHSLEKTYREYKKELFGFAEEHLKG